MINSLGVIAALAKFVVCALVTFEQEDESNEKEKKLVFISKAKQHFLTFFHVINNFSHGNKIRKFYPLTSQSFD